MSRSSFSRSELESYAQALEYSLYQLHEQFWYDLDERGVLRPVASVGDERQLLLILQRALQTLSVGKGHPIRFRARRRLDRRLLGGFVFLFSFIFLLDVLWNDVLMPYHQAILSFLGL